MDTHKKRATWLAGGKGSRGNGASLSFKSSKRSEHMSQTTSSQTPNFIETTLTRV